MDFLKEFVASPAIAVICFFVGFACKRFDNEKLNKFIPVICGLLGAILGIVAFITLPDYIGAENWLCALATGIISGLAATGAHQIYKQLAENE